MSRHQRKKLIFDHSLEVIPELSIDSINQLDLDLVKSLPIAKDKVIKDIPSSLHTRVMSGSNLSDQKTAPLRFGENSSSLGFSEPDPSQSQGRSINLGVIPTKKVFEKQVNMKFDYNSETPSGLTNPMSMSQSLRKIGIERATTGKPNMKFRKHTLEGEPSSSEF